jgi:glycosyltransferase involved in cell wall biosynthesis
LPEKTRSNYQLVLAGGYGWKIDNELDYIKKLNDENIIITGYISDDQKNWLYKNASVFVLPSHYEGFGMPILEAMSFGTPTAVSDIAVFKEVSGNASLYFDKDNPKDISNKLDSLLNNKELQNKLSALGNQRLKKYSWQENAKKIGNLL